MIKEELEKLKNREKAAHLSYFFKTGKGQYGEGDLFLGIVVPEQRKIAKQYYKQADFCEIQALLESPFHECRLTALLILTFKFKQEKEKVYSFYLKNTRHINNWDLVDLSCPNIIGGFLIDKDRKLLFDFARSENMWERRMAIVSTYAFIKNNDFQDTLKIALLLLEDKHDLIHKAVGWMLREIGKRDEKILTDFLMQNYDQLPRTTLRYAIERFDETKRKRFLKKEF